MRILPWVVLLADAVPAFCAWQTTVANAATPHGSVTDGFRIAPGSLIRVGFRRTVEDRAEPLWIDPAKSRVTLRASGSDAITVSTFRESDPLGVVIRTPDDIPLGPLEIVLNDLGPARGEMVPHSFRLFTISNGFGPARADNGLANPAKPESIVTLWGTGLNRGLVTASVGDKPMEVLYAGPAPSLHGVDQLNLQMPSEVPSGCYTELKVSVAGEDANPVTITTGTEPCKHPLGFTSEQLARLDRGGRVNMASIELSTAVGPTPSDPPQWEAMSRLESAMVRITAIDSSLAWLLYQPSRIPIGSCAVVEGPVTAALIFAGAPPGGDGDKPKSLGQSITLAGPDKSLELRPVHPDNPAIYDLPLPSRKPEDPSVWTAGKWTIRGEGNSELDSFAVDITLTPPLELMDLHKLRSIDRTADLEIRWKSNSDVAGEVVTVSLRGYQSQLSCSVSTAAGSIVIPRSDLARLRPIPAGSSYPAVLHITQGRPADQPLLLPLKTSMPVKFTHTSAYLMKVDLR